MIELELVEVVILPSSWLELNVFLAKLTNWILIALNSTREYALDARKDSILVPTIYALKWTHFAKHSIPNLVNAYLASTDTNLTMDAAFKMSKLLVIWIVRNLRTLYVWSVP